MNTIEAIVLGAIQGASEWLPISSEAQTMLYMLNHLKMGPQIALSYAIFLHIGTLLAVLLRFNGEFKAVLKNFSPGFKLTRILIFATLATAISALPLYFWLKTTFSEYQGTFINLFIGLMLILTGLILKASSKSGGKNLDQITDRDIAFVGFVQGFSILPGISRSGVTIAALLGSKIEQETALTISFLMSVPAVLGAVLIDFEAIKSIPVQVALVSIISSFIVGFITMDVLLRLARRTSFWIFCIALGVITIAVLALNFI